MREKEARVHKIMIINNWKTGAIHLAPMNAKVKSLASN